MIRRESWKPLSSLLSNNPSSSSSLLLSPLLSPSSPTLSYSLLSVLETGTDHGTITSFSFFFFLCWIVICCLFHLPQWDTPRLISLSSTLSFWSFFFVWKGTLLGRRRKNILKRRHVLPLHACLYHWPLSLLSMEGLSLSHSFFHSFTAFSLFWNKWRGGHAWQWGGALGCTFPSLFVTFYAFSCMPGTGPSVFFLLASSPCCNTQAEKKRKRRQT